MAKRSPIVLSLIFAAGISGCGRSGDVKPSLLDQQPVCPRPAELPASLMQEPTYETKIRAILFESDTSATPKCADCKQP